MQAGFGPLRLSPKTFWAMTPRELAACLSPPGQETARPGRAALAALIAKFPDKEREDPWTTT